MRKVASTLVAAALLSTAAFAQVLEVEPNDTFAGAQVLPANFFTNYGAGAVAGRLDAGNVDYYAVSLPANEIVTASTFDSTPPAGSLDTYLGAFRPDGTLHDFDDDDGPGLLSSLYFVTPVAGMWRFAVTGFGDPDFNGTGHGQSGAYRLVLSIPEPSTLGLVLVGLGFALRRR